MLKRCAYAARSIYSHKMELCTATADILPACGGHVVSHLCAVVRIDTHGCKAVVKENITVNEAKALECYYDSLNHHQGYFVIKQDQLPEYMKSL